MATGVRYPAGRPWVLPAEVQEGPGGGRHALVIPAQEVELCHRARLVGLQVLQVEAPHEEILAPDVLRDQMYLAGGVDRAGRGRESVGWGPGSWNMEPLCGERAGHPEGRLCVAGRWPVQLSKFNTVYIKGHFVLSFSHVTQGQNSQIIGKNVSQSKRVLFLSFLSHTNLQEKSPEKKLYFWTKTQTGFYSHWYFKREAPPSCRKMKLKGSYRRCQALSAGSPGQGPQNHDQLRGEHTGI